MFVWHAQESAVLAKTNLRVPKQSVYKQSVYILWLW